MRVPVSLLAAALTILFVDSAAAGSAGRCGGTGGSKTRTLTCPSGQYIAALAARGGVFVDEYSIACRKIPVSGQPGSLGGFKSAGPGGGTQNDSDTCDTGHAVISIVFSSGSFIDRAEGGSCAPRSGDHWTQNALSSASIRIGGPGGIRCIISCPVGEAMYKLTIKTGSFIDSIKGDCRK